MIAESSPPTSRLRLGQAILSARVDVAIVLIPFLIATAALIALKGAGAKEPLWAYLLCFVAFDVAHVWGTAYIAWLDGENLRKRPALYTLSVPLSFVVAFALHHHSPALFWMAISYFAIFHFAKQQYGFIAIYKARMQERAALDYHLDKLALWTGALGPVLMWHATPHGQFDWFDDQADFLFHLPPSITPAIGVFMGVVFVLWCARQLHRLVVHHEVNVGKCGWMIASWVSWFIGIRMTEHLLISAAFLNFFHGLPFLALVWWRINRKYQGLRVVPRRSRFVAWVAQRRHILAFYGLCLALALVEETLWDGMVWQEYLPGLTGWTFQAPGALALSFWVALLSTPQIAHYVLDAFIWKLNAHNPDLRAALFASPEQA